MLCVLNDCNNKESRFGLCQKHYREDRKKRIEKGERFNPGPKPDSSKPHSKHKPLVRKFATDTHCPNGHFFEEVGFYTRSTGKKQCKVCRANSSRRKHGKSEVTEVGIWNKHKTHCRKGHEYSQENTYIHPKTKARRCLICHGQLTKAWQLMDKYGLTVDEYEQMLDDQNNQCLGCFTEFTVTPRVDHDHETGAVRGLLCNGCNIVLGHAYDNPEVLKNLANYLDAFSKTKGKK